MAPRRSGGTPALAAAEAPAVASYGATGLPPGLGIDSTTGAISGTPGTADANTADATVTVTDIAGNRTWRAVARWSLAPHLAMSLDGARRETANDDAPEHGVQFRFTLRW